MDRQELFLKYIDNLYLDKANSQYGKIGKYIKYVKQFVNSGMPITYKGYVLFIRNNIYNLSVEPTARCALCDFLNFAGVGRKKKREKKTRPLEKLSDISERNKKIINDFIYYLTQNEDYSPHTLEVYRFSVKTFFEYANEVSVDNYKGFVRTLEEKGFSPQTIRIRITALERLSKFLKKPIELKRPKFTRKLNTDNVPTEREYNKLLAYLQAKSNKDNYFYIKILATTGARVSEFLQFTWQDILNGEVTLKGKGNKYRRVFFNRKLQNEVRKYVDENGKNGYVATGRFGRLSSRGLSMNMKDWGEKCGIDKSKMHPHAFRHFFAKMYLKKNKDIIQLADLLGHGSVDTTRIYLQKSYDEQKKEFNRSVTW